MDAKVEYRFDHEQMITYEIFKGNITLDDLLQHSKKKFNDPGHTDSYAVILDIREAIFKLSEEEKNKFYKAISEYTSDMNMNRKCAILTNNPQEVVISELFKLKMVQLSPINIRTFSTTAAALEWIKT